MPRLYRGNPLAFPGRNPGFDPSHPASNGSFVASVSCLPPINLLTGKALTNTSATFLIDGGIGPAAVFSTSALLNTAGVSVPGGNSTVAAIIRATAPSGFQAFVAPNNTADAAGVILLLNTSAPALFYGSATHALGSNITTGVPYFIAASVISGVGANIVAVNLVTGQVLSGFVSSASAVAAGGSGIVIGNSGKHNQGFAGNVAVAMYSTATLSLGQLLSWAADPWAFWYPPAMQNVLFSGLKGASLSSLPPLRTLVGVGT